MSVDAPIPIVISISGRDRIGLIASVSAALFDLGLNLGDTAFAVVGSNCKFNCVAELSSGVGVADVRRELAALEVLAGAVIEVEDHLPRGEATPYVRVTHEIWVSGGDRPGLVARLSEVFVAFDANVLRMTSNREERDQRAVYHTNFAVAVAAERADACMAAVSNTAGQLDLDCHWKAL